MFVCMILWKTEHSVICLQYTHLHYITRVQGHVFVNVSGQYYFQDVLETSYLALLEGIWINLWHVNLKLICLPRGCVLQEIKLLNLTHEEHYVASCEWYFYRISVNRPHKMSMSRTWGLYDTIHKYRISTIISMWLWNSNFVNCQFLSIVLSHWMSDWVKYQKIISLFNTFFTAWWHL